MTFYLAEKPWEPEILGIKDGLSQAVVDEQGFNDKDNYKIFKDNFACLTPIADAEILRLNFSMECVKMKRKAKLTDFLWFSPMSYNLISPRVEKILSEFKLDTYKYFDATVTENEIKHKYKFMHMASSDLANINFVNSEFETGNKYDGYKRVGAKSFEDLRNLKSLFYTRKIAFKDIESTFDMFQTRMVPEYIISQRLRDAFIDQGVTGIKLKPIEIEFE